MELNSRTSKTYIVISKMYSKTLLTQFEKNEETSMNIYFWFVCFINSYIDAPQKIAINQSGNLLLQQLPFGC